MDYIIGTGWWCDGSGVHAHTKHQQYVDKNTRQKEFFNLWYKAVKKYANPKKIIMVDSGSPIKPDLKGKSDVAMYSLDKNYGAALVGTQNKKLSGWDRGVLASASLAFFEGCDYYVYVEQDCLIYGKGIIEKAIKSMGNKPMLLGNGRGTPQPIQQSFFVVKRSFIPRFLAAEMTANSQKLSISPEKRYANSYKGFYGWLPFGNGRVRPLDFTKKHFYAQHLREDEVQRFKKILK